MTDPRTRIAEIIQDYADGLLDSREDAVDAIVEAMGGEDALKLKVVGPLDLKPIIGEKSVELPEDFIWPNSSGADLSGLKPGERRNFRFTEGAGETLHFTAEAEPLPDGRIRVFNIRAPDAKTPHPRS